MSPRGTDYSWRLMLQSGGLQTLSVLFQATQGDPRAYSSHSIEGSLRVLGQWAWESVSRREQRYKNLKWGWLWLPVEPTVHSEDETLVLHLDPGRGPETTQIHQAWSDRSTLEITRPCVGSVD